MAFNFPSNRLPYLRPPSRQPPRLSMAVFKATYDKLYTREGGETFFYKCSKTKGERIEGALLKLKKPNHLLQKGKRWRRYWVTADGEYVCYFRNNLGNDDELRKLKPTPGWGAGVFPLSPSPRRVASPAQDARAEAGPDRVARGRADGRAVRGGAGVHAQGRARELRDAFRVRDRGRAPRVGELHPERHRGRAVLGGHQRVPGRGEAATVAPPFGPLSPSPCVQQPVL